jgi:hypothetical protein
MIQEYVNKLIDNLPNNIKNNKNPLVLDLVLDGGIFNGSYLIGALYFIKEMEKRNYIKIDRVSGCSIGSVAAFLYLSDNLDIITQIYKIVHTEFKESHTLNAITNLKKIIGNSIDKKICNKVNGRLFVTYNNIKKGKKIVKNTYKNENDIINTIIKSCYVPYLIDGNLLYKNKYIDGINPYIFKIEPNKKILYLDLFGYDKIGYLLNVKNENTNFHRVLSGLLDIHNFYIKQTNTQMCSYVNEWSITNILFNLIKIFIERIILYVIYLFVYLKKYIPREIDKTILYKLFIKIINDVFIITLDTYCL